MASSRRFAEKSDATMVSTPRTFSAAMMAMPIGPQPITNAVSPRVMADLFTACRPTAIGSVSAAWRTSSPLGSGNRSGADSTIRSA